MRNRHTFTVAVFLLYLQLVTAPAARAQTELLVAPAEAPLYELSNLRMADGGLGGLQKVVLVDFKRTRKGAGQVALVGRTAGHRFQLREFGNSKFLADSGTVLLDGGIGLSGLQSTSFELWLQQPAYLGGKDQAFMLSNPVSQGTLNSTTTARPWTDAEKASYAEIKKSQTPPASLPANRVAVDSLMKLVPGMPVLGGWKGEWEPAELIALDHDTSRVLLKYEKYPEPLTWRPLAQWLAVDPAILAKAANSPGAFKPSVRTLPGGALPVPADLIDVTKNTKLVVGTPLRMEEHFKWDEVFVVALHDDDNVTVGWKGHSHVWDRKVARSRLLITKETLAELDKPETAKQLEAAFLAQREKDSPAPDFPGGSDSSRTGRGRRKLQDYPIRIPLPKNAQVVSEDLILKEGTPLAANWGSSWRGITVIEENDDGTVRVHWNEFSDAWDGDMPRDQLIIENKTVRKLTKRSQAATNPNGATTEGKSLRIWTDSSGSFKIEAVFVKKTDSGVTLRRKDGREVTLAFEKLCLDDQNVVNELTGNEKNPFEP